MKRKLFFLALFCGMAGGLGAQVHMPAASPTQIIRQDFGLSYMELVYSRPSLRGRHFIGDLLPYNEIWRTGANTATRIVFHEPVEILGHRVDTGAYAIYTIPRSDGEWTFILNKGIHNDGVQGYRQDKLPR